jgi:type VI secretion system protein ImpB
MAKEDSAAPRSRINIRYKPSTGGKEEVELPLKVMMLGDYTQRADETPLEERKAISVDKNNFDKVLKEQKLELTFNAEDRLSGKAGEELAVQLKINSMKDFGPEAVAEQVPELKKLTELREALMAVRGPLGTQKEFVRKLQNILQNEAEVEKLLKELGAKPEGE